MYVLCVCMYVCKHVCRKEQDEQDTQSERERQTDGNKWLGLSFRMCSDQVLEYRDSMKDGKRQRETQEKKENQRRRHAAVGAQLQHGTVRAETSKLIACCNSFLAEELITIENMEDLCGALGMVRIGKIDMQSDDPDQLAGVQVHRCFLRIAKDFIQVS